MIETDFALSVIVAPGDRARALRAGFRVVETAPPDALAVDADPDAILQAFAMGASRVVCDLSRAAPPWPSLRWVALFCETFATILTSGDFRDNLRSLGGLVASERLTRQGGGIVFVRNPTDQPLRGAVFPAISDIELGPGGVFAWVHDAPIGVSASYLDAYAGLVKSDASVAFAHIRPDPFMGARVFVYGEIGERREVALFGRGHGEGKTIEFAPWPTVHEIAESQVVALTTDLAGRTWLAPDTRAAVGYDDVTLWTDDGPVGVAPGATYVIAPGGQVETRDTARLPSTDVPLTLAATVHLPDPVSGRLDLGVNLDFRLRRNGIDADPDDLSLPAGESVLELHFPQSAPFGPAALLIDGACWQMGIDRWRLVSL